jgi:hypothetical protein
MKSGFQMECAHYQVLGGVVSAVLLDAEVGPVRELENSFPVVVSPEVNLSLPFMGIDRLWALVSNGRGVVV